MEKEINLLVNNNCFKAGRKMTPKGIVVHSVGCKQPDRHVFVRSWNTPTPNGREVCVHAFLDDKGVTQTLPYDMQCWGCGSGSKGSYNSSHIQFEICEPKTSYTDKNFFLACYNNAVEYCAELCDKYGISPDKICDHSEAHKQGYGSNHSDVGHWWKHHNKTMDTFRADVKKKLALKNPEVTICSDVEVKEVKISLCGNVKAVRGINLDGYNYIKLQDLACSDIEIGYDVKAKTPIIRVKRG